MGRIDLCISFTHLPPVALLQRLHLLLVDEEGAREQGGRVGLPDGAHGGGVKLCWGVWIGWMDGWMEGRFGVNLGRGVEGGSRPLPIHTHTNTHSPPFKHRETHTHTPGSAGERPVGSRAGTHTLYLSLLHTHRKEGMHRRTTRDPRSQLTHLVAQGDGPRDLELGDARLADPFEEHEEAPEVVLVSDHLV
jgi:hypothetical protein